MLVGKAGKGPRIPRHTYHRLKRRNWIQWSEEYRLRHKVLSLENTHNWPGQQTMNEHVSLTELGVILYIDILVYKRVSMVHRPAWDFAPLVNFSNNAVAWESFFHTFLWVISYKHHHLQWIYLGASNGWFTLPKTNIAPENGWLEDEMSFWDGIFSGAMLQTC